jgi:TRAP-type C4-dicarboxylate transport system substrate-binding protein
VLVGGTGFHFLMAKPINGLADLQGTRIRVFGTLTAKATQAFGAAPQTIPPGELYPALQRGVVDGAIRAPDDAWSFGERDVYKTMLSPAMLWGTGGVMVPTRSWDNLPPHLQQLLVDVLKEMEPQVLKYFLDSDAASAENLRANGMNIVELSPADVERLAQARNLYWTDVVEKSPQYGPRLQTILEPYVK